MQVILFIKNIKTKQKLKILQKKHIISENKILNFLII